MIREYLLPHIIQISWYQPIFYTIQMLAVLKFLNLNWVTQEKPGKAGGTSFLVALAKACLQPVLVELADFTQNWPIPIRLVTCRSDLWVNSVNLKSGQKLAELPQLSWNRFEIRVNRKKLFFLLNDENTFNIKLN